MVTEGIEKYLIPDEEQLIAAFPVKMSFLYVPHAHPDTLEDSQQHPGVIAFTENRLLIIYESGAVIKRERLYTTPLTRISAVWTRLGPSSRAEHPVALMLPAGLCCQFTVAMPVTPRRELEKQLEFLLTRIIIVSGAARGPVDDEGALAALQHHEEEGGISIDMQERKKKGAQKKS